MTAWHIRLPIHGLACGGGGALTIEESLSEVAGVTRVYVNPATETAYIDCDPEICTPAQLVASVERCGFRAGAPTIQK